MVTRSALPYPEAAQQVGVTVGLLPELPVGVSLAVAGLAFPDEGELVAARRADVAVEGVEDDVGFAAAEPAKKGRVAAVEHLLPGFVPVEGGGAFGPEGLNVLHGVGVEGLVIGHAGVTGNFGVGVEPLAGGGGELVFDHELVSSHVAAILAERALNATGGGGPHVPALAP